MHPAQQLSLILSADGYDSEMILKRNTVLGSVNPLDINPVDKIGLVASEQVILPENAMDLIQRHIRDINYPFYRIKKNRSAIVLHINNVLHIYVTHPPLQTHKYFRPFPDDILCQQTVPPLFVNCYMYFHTYPAGGEADKTSPPVSHTQDPLPHPPLSPFL